MLTLDSAIIKDDFIITCKYYEIEEKCREITMDYCNKSIENQEKFQNFSKNYHTFRPYFDFIVCVLGYKILNPQMEESNILIGKENHMFFYNLNKQELEKNFRYDCSDDKTLQIYPMSLDSSTFHDCLIDGNNNHILPKDMFGHVHILQQILNLLLISNKEVCEEYLNYQSDIGFFVSRYLPLIRFQADRQGPFIITRSFYRKSNLTEKQEIYLSELLGNRYTYPSFLYDVDQEENFSNAKDLGKELAYDREDSFNKKV